MTALIIAMHCPAIFANCRAAIVSHFKALRMQLRNLRTFELRTCNQGPLTPMECTMNPMN